MRYTGFLFGVGALVTLSLRANNLQITNFSVNQANQTVSFQVSWQNAWRLTTPPNNWDAVWIFVKFRACNEFTQPWTHGVISTNLADHTIPAALEPVLSDGSGIGIDPAPNNLGIMLRPATPGTYATFGPHSVTLKITNMPTTGQYDFRIFGIEMVFIPEGAYTLGTLDGWHSTSTEAARAFDQNGNNGDPHVPYNITSENAISLRWAGSGNTSITVPASFPKGFKAFHVMKYEISQGQYAAFLNTLPASNASLRYLGSYNTNRNRLANNGSYPNQYYSDREDRAQNFLSWHDLCAYLDWAALRPLTEMEYEKICRGPLPEVRGEYAWGTTNIVFGNTIGLIPENGTEVFTDPANANCTGGAVAYTGGDGGQGPVRVGIHAKPNSPSREASGASYYGVMDMSGNVWEMVVMVSAPDGTVGSPTYTGNWGDGVLDWTTGTANQPSWPLGNPGGFGLRGGYWGNNWWEHRVSARNCSYPGHTCKNTRNPDHRSSDAGGRGAR
ncbi:MAG: formylglycine-generating enzyme family protein [Bacteroidia bacterium]|nr:formylglycine-generating enzyme family protein [Bacteroidia bacterium]MDW8056802.1 SUMF1/EgtB/PvdO family nonheme iron enzyme [Bacteroidia bacterium]